MFKTATLLILFLEIRKFCWRLLADANRTSMTNTYCVYTVLRYSR